MKKLFVLLSILAGCASEPLQIEKPTIKPPRAVLVEPNPAEQMWMDMFAVSKWVDEYYFQGKPSTDLLEKIAEKADVFSDTNRAMIKEKDECEVWEKNEEKYGGLARLIKQNKERTKFIKDNYERIAAGWNNRANREVIMRVLTNPDYKGGIVTKSGGLIILPNARETEAYKCLRQLLRGDPDAKRQFVPMLLQGYALPVKREEWLEKKGNVLRLEVERSLSQVRYRTEKDIVSEWRFRIKDAFRASHSINLSVFLNNPHFLCPWIKDSMPGSFNKKNKFLVPQFSFVPDNEGNFNLEITTYNKSYFVLGGNLDNGI